MRFLWSPNQGFGREENSLLSVHLVLYFVLKKLDFKGNNSKTFVFSFQLSIQYHSLLTRLNRRLDYIKYQLLWPQET